MSARKSPQRFVAAVGGVGVLAWSLTMFFLFAYPEIVLPEAAEPAFVDSWFHSVATVVHNGVPLLVVAGVAFVAVGALLFDASRLRAVE